MALDKLQIGVRIRNIRENIFKETRAAFADRCNMTESHIGQIERGEIMPSIIAIDKIASTCGVDLNYIMYGKKTYNNTRKNIDMFLDRSNQDELKAFYRCMIEIKKLVYK